jgi:hypothetical protein
VSGSIPDRLFSPSGFRDLSPGLGVANSLRKKGEDSGTGLHYDLPQVRVAHLPNLIQHLASEAEQTVVLSSFFRRRYGELGFSQ